MRQLNQLFRTLLLVAAAALPIIVFSVAMVVLFDRQQNEAVEASLRQTARSAIRAVDGLIRDQAAILGALANSPLLDAGALAPFRQHAERVMARNPNWLGVYLFERDTGRALMAMTTPAVAAVPARSIRAALEGSRLSGDPMIGRAVAGSSPGNSAFVPFGITISPRGGGEAYLLAASVRSQAFTQALMDEGIPEAWTAAALDREYRIIGRTRAPETFVGTQATESLTREIDRANENFFFSLNKEGNRVYTAFARSPASGWTAAIGVPAEVIEKPLRRSLQATVGGGIGAFALATLLGIVLIYGNARRQKLERLLEAERAAERRLGDIAANFPGVIFRRVLHPDGRISYPYLSSGAAVFTGALPVPGEGGAAIEQIGRMIVPEDRERWKEALFESARTLSPYYAEGRLIRSDGAIRWVRSAANAQRRPDGTIVWDGVVLDITDRVKAEEDLRAALVEKERLLDEKITLLNEVHHRVKNNLQIMTSLLRMERRQVHDPQARLRLDMVGQRIQAMARLHEQLYASGDLGRIEIGDTLRQIGADIVQIQGTPNAEISVDADSCRCALRIAIPLALLANELMTNSLKHAFPGGRKGRVEVTLRRDGSGSEIVLVVADDGIGMASPLTDASGGGIGMKLIDALARQIDAELVVEPNEGGGARVTVRIPGGCADD